MIKIISLYYKNFNFGGLLQAYALCRFLSEKGYHAEQISFERNSFTRLSLLQRFNRISIKKLSDKFFRLYTYIRYCHNIDISVRRRLFSSFQNQIPHTTVVNSKDVSSIVNANDIFITGSDQVWNPLYAENAFFLDFVPNSNKKIAYAASMGITDIPQRYLKKISIELNRFTYISVRENELKKNPIFCYK